MSCCPEKMEPAKETVDGTGGVMKTFGKTSLFVTGPAKAKAGVISLPDIFGLHSGHIKQDAVELGKLGYAVVVVDAADGDYSKESNIPGWVVKILSSLGVVNLVMGRWLNKYSLENFAGARIADAIAYLQQEAGVEAISSYGYCWGAYIGAAQSAADVPVIKGHVSFHPAWLCESMLKGDGAVEKMAERISVPQLLCSAGNDPDFVCEGGSVEKILKSKADIGAQCEVVDFPDMIHGWVSRGDRNDPATKAAVDKAWEKAIQFTKTVNPL
ncbi:hypothetical protein BBJ28_00012425 [Nothophytophthora sp. Chile5]|nr:hypothetical protein BBJ28_00012425 [Nothophytophthora sp. Chile5]